MKINPIARAVAMQRRKYATQTVKPKKGKGSYERKTKDIQKKIKSYPIELIYGWGLDFYTGCITEEYNLNTIVSDNHTICHLNSQTFEQNKIKKDLQEQEE